jgi:hypothetical protein
MRKQDTSKKSLDLWQCVSYKTKQKHFLVSRVKLTETNSQRLLCEQFNAPIAFSPPLVKVVLSYVAKVFVEL